MKWTFCHRCWSSVATKSVFRICYLLTPETLHRFDLWHSRSSLTWPKGAGGAGTGCNECGVEITKFAGFNSPRLAAGKFIRKEGFNMKAIQIMLVLCIAGFTLSCSSVYDVQYDYDQRADFTGLKTYDWLPVPDKADIESLDIARVKAAVNAELQAKGLIMTSGNPDLLIAEHLGTKDKVKVRDWGYSYAPYGGYWGGHWGSGGVSVYEYEEGSLILDFVDAESKNKCLGVAKA
jgi:hypothetical protein